MKSPVRSASPPSVEVYSRQIQELMGYMPGFWARWSITLLLLLVLAFAGLMSQVQTHQQRSFMILPNSASLAPAPAGWSSGSVQQVEVVGESAARAELLAGAPCQYVVQLNPGASRFLIRGQIVKVGRHHPPLTNVQIRVVQATPTTLAADHILSVAMPARSVLAQSFHTVFRQHR